MFRLVKKVQPAQWLSAIGLLGMMAICIRVAVALSGTSASFTPQSMPTGSMAQEIVTNPTLTSGNESLFRTDFEKQYWSGNVYDYPINAAGAVNTSGERWSGGFAPNLDAQVNPLGVFNGALRFIGTMSSTASKVPFLSANLSAAQQTALTASGYSSTQIVNFLRGDHSLEGVAGLRQRFTPGGAGTLPTVLGDIIHSRPYYLADVTTPTVFVGANDGMLHAINVNNGTENWAYVPSMLLSKMSTLAANPYVHDYFVDGEITVGYDNVGYNSANSILYPGQRILVGALGAGGKGLYALNIDGAAGLTAASDQDAANKVVWEITPTAVNYATPQMYDGSAYVAANGYGNLGYTLSAPLIKTMNISGASKHVVLVGNGYNNGGDYQAYLFVINADDGKLIRAVKADNTCTGCSTATNGTSASPNGLMNLLPFDSNADGYIDTVYAGDLNGTMWKFNLLNTTPSSWTANLVFVTNPKQPITATPAALPHPSGTGFIVDFATGGIFTGTQPVSGVSPTGDLGDTSSFYVYGIWDGAPATNNTLVTPTITERCYDAAAAPTALPCATTSTTVTRVRRISASNPNWATGGNKGWQVALPIGGERVVGDGSFISSGRYYFSTYNPTISYLVPNTSSYVWGENWQMALDGVTGGSIDPFMDLNGDGAISTADLVHYTASDTLVVQGTQTVNTPILSPAVDGVEVGKWVGRGVQSQPTLVKLANLFTTLFNTNPDVTIPYVAPTGTGVTGGHFDEDIYFGSVSPAAQATATLTLAAQTAIPTTLGGITIGGVSVVPAQTFANGSSTSANATTIKNSVIAGSGYTATSAGSTVTFKAPAGASYNGAAITILPGTSITPVTAVAAVNASQSITFTNSAAVNPAGVTITVNGTNIMTSSSPGSAMTSAQLAAWVASHSTLTGYTISNTAGSSVVTIAANGPGPAFNITSLTVTSSENASSDISVNAATAGTSATVPISGHFTVTALTKNTSISIKCGGTNIVNTFTSTNSNTQSTVLAGFYTSVNGKNSGVYSTTCSASPSTAAPTSVACTVAVSAGVSACSGGFTFPGAVTTSANTGPSGGTIASAASRTFSFTNTSAVNPTNFQLMVSVNGAAATNILSSASPGSPMSSSQLASWVASNITPAFAANYTVTANTNIVTITAKTSVATTYDITSITPSGSAPLLTSTNGAAVAGVTAVTGVTGQNDMTPSLSVTAFSGGSDGSTSGMGCTGANGSQCNRNTHDHQYDKIYDVTGVDMRNPNDVNFDLSKAVPNINQNFKVIIHNQYLNPAATLNIGNSNYLPNVNFGYISIKGYTTSATLDLATLPTYNQNAASSGDGFSAPKYIASLVMNLPVDALTAKDWWGNGDLRAGLIPTQPSCVFNSAGAHDGNMYQPINAPANSASFGYPADGPGTLGYTNSTTPATATGVRHNGALTIQIIRDNTPNSDLELNDNLGRPEYGWRVKSQFYQQDVLVEYNTYWHHPNGKCFGSAGWTKAPGPDTGGNPPTPIHTAGATDPKLGNLTGNNGSVTSVVTQGNTTTITYANGTSTVIIRIVNADGSVTTITVNIPGGTTPVTAIVNSNRSVVVTIGGIATTVAAGSSTTLANGAVISNITTANTAGTSTGGGLLNQNAVGYKRISWKELIRN